jgi:predicted metal-dependent hydrolase
LEKVVHYPEVGDIKYVKSKRAKRINISVRLLKGIVVTVPYHSSYTEAERFVKEKLDWIIKTKNKIEKVEQNQTVFTNDDEYRTKFRTLKLIPEERKNLRLHVSDNFIEIYYPQYLLVTHAGVQDAIKRAMEHAWNIEAHEYLPSRLNDLAQQFDFVYNKLTIKNTRSFWGSCAPDNSITLSSHLMHLPDKLLDYVLLHELCHIIHKNHGKEFWALLNQVTNGQARLLAKEMRKYNTQIY